jgi:speckle-type POZ protein
LYEGYHLKLYPAGLDKDSADFVAVFVGGPFDDSPYSCRAPARFSLEILDASRKHTVFDDSTARSELTLRDHQRRKGYVRFVNRREMEASCCVREDDDSLTIRFTLSIDREAIRPLMWAPLPRDEAAEGAETAVGSRTMTIGSFSRFRAALRPGERAYGPHFALGRSSWYLKVYPNGHCDSSKDCVAVFLGRGKSDDPATTAEFCFELAIDGLLGKEAEFTKHTFDRDAPVHASPYLVKISDLASAQQMVNDDCLIVRCHLRVIKFTTPTLLLPAAAPTVTDPPCEVSNGIGKTPTKPGVVAETEDDHTSDSEQTPLLTLAHLHQR